jgi:hypothetical protein
MGISGSDETATGIPGEKTVPIDMTIPTKAANHCVSMQ